MIRSPPPPAATTRRRNGQLVLPIVYIQPQSKTQRLLPVLIVSAMSVWIFAIGTLLERLPPGQSLPYLMTGASSSDDHRGPLAVMEAILETPVRFLEELDEDNMITRHIIDEDKEDNKDMSATQTHTSTSASATTNAASKPHTAHPTSATTDSSTRLLVKENESRQIPNVLIFTHAINLLEYQSINDKTNRTNEDRLELVALQKNIQSTIDKHPQAKVRFLTDKDCIQSLQSALGQETPLVKFFQKETTGMYKADICRGAALWETGGIYLDVDVGVRMPLFDILQANTTFATTLVHKDSMHPGNFFQAFMATTPRNAILERYLQLFLEYYQGKLSRPIKRGPLGVILLRQAFDDVVMDPPGEVVAMDLEQVSGMKEKDKHVRLGPKLLDTKRNGRIQLWQEVLYSAKFLPNVIPAPTWGTRRACHFVVVANRKFPLTVPLYSRIEGSRMCPSSKIDTAEVAKKT